MSKGSVLKMSFEEERQFTINVERQQRLERLAQVREQSKEQARLIREKNKIMQRKAQSKEWEVKKLEYEKKKEEELSKLKRRAAASLAAVGKAHDDAKMFIKSETDKVDELKTAWQYVEDAKLARNQTSSYLLKKEMEEKRRVILEAEQRREAVIIESMEDRSIAHNVGLVRNAAIDEQREKARIINNMKRQTDEKMEMEKKRRVLLPVNGATLSLFSKTSVNLGVTKHAPKEANGVVNATKERERQAVLNQEAKRKEESDFHAAQIRGEQEVLKLRQAAQAREVKHDLDKIAVLDRMYKGNQQYAALYRTAGVNGVNKDIKKQKTMESDFESLFLQENLFPKTAFLAINNNEANNKFSFAIDSDKLKDSNSKVDIRLPVPVVALQDLSNVAEVDDDTSKSEIKDNGEEGDEEKQKELEDDEELVVDLEDGEANDEAGDDKLKESEIEESDVMMDEDINREDDEEVEKPTSSTKDIFEINVDEGFDVAGALKEVREALGSNEGEDNTKDDYLKREKEWFTAAAVEDEEEEEASFQSQNDEKEDFDTLFDKFDSISRKGVADLAKEAKDRLGEVNTTHIDDHVSMEGEKIDLNNISSLSFVSLKSVHSDGL